MVVSVRGAVQIEENSAPAIAKGAQELVLGIMRENGITEDSLISVQFSQTKDLDAANPASALRKIGFTQVPLWCVQEAYIVGGMERVLRLMLTLNWEGVELPQPLFLGGAKALRPDLG